MKLLSSAIAYNSRSSIDFTKSPKHIRA